MKKAGYSLVEVLIAIAITSVVLLTVVTLFYMGRRNVYSGKQQTYAVSVGTRMLEDISAMSASDLLSNFNINDQTTKTTVKVFGVGGTSASGEFDFNNSAGRDTSSCTTNGSPPPAFTCTDDTAQYLSAWRSLIDPAKMTNGEVGLVVTPRDVPATPPPSCENPPCPWTSARYLKVRAWVAWDEAKNRRRIAFFDTTKVNRD
jgi:prepilin-type N-terminal cleavage/methylation domain-containing protein